MLRLMILLGLGSILGIPIGIPMLFQKNWKLKLGGGLLFALSVYVVGFMFMSSGHSRDNVAESDALTGIVCCLFWSLFNGYLLRFKPPQQSPKVILLYFSIAANLVAVVFFTFIWLLSGGM